MSTFVHLAHAAAMEEQGFVLLDFLAPTELEALLDAYKRFDAGLDVPFYTSMWSSQETYRQAVHESVCQLLSGPMARVVTGFAPFAGGFLVKQPAKEGGEVVLHQDWSYVDERRDRTLIVWCPLRDVDLEDGCLGLIPGTHKMLDCVRTNGDARVVSPYTGLEQELYQAYGVELPMRAGQAVLYDARLLHASRPNRSHRVRVAAGMATAPAPLRLHHYFSESADRIEEYEVPDNFYWKLVRPGERPAGPGIERTNRTLGANPKPTRDELHALCAAAANAYVGPGVRLATPTAVTSASTLAPHD
jgi:hypothetical protein